MPANKKECTDLFAHSLDNLKTVSISGNFIHKECPICGYREALTRSKRNVLFVNNLLKQTKKWGADDNRKELIQPLDNKGNVNEEFTEAYGFNPFDERTKEVTPVIQGGMA